jgi:tetratricopeptide (TPR) repeat protein
MSELRNKNLTVLVALLLGIVIAFLSQYPPVVDPILDLFNSKPKMSALPGKNKIFSVRTKKVTPEAAYLEVDYFYNGRLLPPDYGNLGALVYFNEKDSIRYTGRFIRHKIEKGKNTVEIKVGRMESVKSNHVTSKLKLQMIGASGSKLAKKEMDYEIEWPVLEKITSLDKYKLKNNLEYAISANDSNNVKYIREAKDKMEQNIVVDPGFLESYLELARSHMKLNWNETGLSQAENVLKRALELDNNFANAHVLMGYVYTHTNRYKKAETSFRLAEELGTDNLWLYTNWGELKLMQREKEKALSFYRKVAAHPRKMDRNDRPLLASYKAIINILFHKKQWNEVDSTYQAMLKTFQDKECVKYEYSKFLLFYKQDFDKAMQIAKDSLRLKCYNPEQIKTLIAAIYLAKWAKTPNKSDASAKDLKRNAETLQYDYVKIIRFLAQSENSSKIIDELSKTGLSINDLNSKKMTALAYTVAENDLESSRNLINMGADVNITVNEDNWTPLMIAVSNRNEIMTKVLIEAGADDELKTNSGITVHDLAERFGNSEIKQLLRTTKI